ncbi:uncharacterized protein BDV17DRAFT_45184 [Aspergillus undulatus]|uniref:uncharacterized protein n=1 Tax=Aspergillus undulatus TaxID=1810928 RepID=UPI003CCD4FC8
MPKYSHVELRTLQGRDTTEDEIPVIDLSQVDNGLEERKHVAAKIRAAAEGTGFFYVKNHEIPEELIQRALHQAQVFFAQSAEEKEKVLHSKFPKNDGYHGVGTTQTNNKESHDQKETFSVRYNPFNDPTVSDRSPSPDHSQEGLWTGTSHPPGFKETTLELYRARLSLALDLEETYLDAVTTHPGADGLYVHYHGTSTNGAAASINVGIGSHTDIQCITLLWQDNSGGLQVLSANGEWLDARPIEGTLVVSIG